MRRTTSPPEPPNTGIFSGRDLVGLLGRGLTVGARFAVVLVLGREYALVDVGAYGLVTATVSFSLFLVGLDYYTFTTREGIRDPRAWPELMREQFGVQARFYLLLAVPLGALGLSGLLEWGLVAWSFGLVLTEHVSLEAHRLLTARGNTLNAHITYFLRGGGWAIPWSVTALVMRLPLWTLWLSWLAGGLVAALYGVAIERHLLRRAVQAVGRRGRVHQGLRVGLTFLASTLALRATLSIDRYLIAGFRGDAEVGVYTFHASAAVAILVLVEAAVVVADLPRLLEFPVGSKGLRAEFQRFRSRVRIATASVVAMIITMAWPVYAIVDPSFRENWEVGAWLVAAQAIGTTGLVLHYRLYVQQRDGAIVRASLTALLVAVVADVALIPRFGAAGAAAGTLLAFVAMNAMRYVGVRRAGEFADDI